MKIFVVNEVAYLTREKATKALSRSGCDVVEAEVSSDMELAIQIATGEVIDDRCSDLLPRAAEIERLLGE